MRVALFVPPATYADWYTYPLPGLCYLKAVLQQQGHECAVFDPKFHRWDRTELIQRIAEYRPDVVGLSAMTHDICTGAEIARDIKSQLPGSRMIVGGCHATALPQRTLEEFPIFHYLVHGEAEKTLPELLAGTSNDHLPQVTGIAWRNGTVQVIPRRDFLTAPELDALPFPNMDDYLPRDGRCLSGRKSAYVMFTSRGCPFRCAFCMQVLGTKPRRRSPESICDEMMYARRVYGAHTVRFNDDVFLFPDSRTTETLECMIRHGIPKKMRWHGHIRANYVTPELVELAKRAGCVGLGMGVESGDDHILQSVSRGYTVAQVRTAVQVIHSVGIKLGTYYILGHPGETPETARKTVDLCAELDTDTAAVGVMVPYPGTRIYEMAQHGEGGYKLLSQDWRDYDKYASRCLELSGISHAELLHWQKQALVGLYTRNHRYLDLMRYLWQRRRGVAAVLLHRK